ncbi:hypothetical protein EGX47_02065 [Yersinia pseudotuberculosis]|uniref:Morphogenetic protein n=1 Tax=Yersinia pseudotuberculosis TaxID=633 RepID=A0ABM7ACV1_YERPU|nr:hypothetical protein [Yersinia pseudotuberculosis]AYW90242.1 hypothetical protein EGX47_02065 [Yersinia pseudotuberculosis]
MNEKPILFNAEMVNAILSGRKTQTRRIMKVQPEPSKSRSGDYWFPCNKMQSMVHVSDLLPGNPYMPDAHEFFSTCCPLGGIGDQLWVREAFAAGLCTESTLAYRATHKTEDLEEGWGETIKWTPSIHMPRWASRIDLLITGVRVERLKDISDVDAAAEGCAYGKGNGEIDLAVRPENHFPTLWASIYGAESWQANPWVWVIDFERMEAK